MKQLILVSVCTLKKKENYLYPLFGEAQRNIVSILLFNSSAALVLIPQTSYSVCGRASCHVQMLMQLLTTVYMVVRQVPPLAIAIYSH